MCATCGRSGAEIPGAHGQEHAYEHGHEHGYHYDHPHEHGSPDLVRLQTCSLSPAAIALGVATTLHAA